MMPSRQTFKELKILFWVVGLMLSSYVLSQFLPLNAMGIQPRSRHGLIGLFFSPFLHGSLTHLFGNLGVFLPLALLFCLLERRGLLWTLLALAFGSGLFTWVFGSQGMHIGASGLVFGLWSHLIFRAYFSRKIKFALGAFFVIALYGGLFFGLFPGKVLVSWESHLGGFLAGSLTGRLRHKENKLVE